MFDRSTAILSSVCSAGALALALASSAQASVILAGNAVTNNQTGYCTFQCSEASEAENFHLSTSSKVETFTVYVASSAGVLGPASGSWSLMQGSAAPGSVLASGQAFGSFVDTGQDLGTVPGFSIYALTFDIPDVDLSAGDYWLGLHVQSAESLYWADTTTGDGVFADSTTTGWTVIPGGGNHNRAFAINGSVNAAQVPEPASLLLSGIGLAGLLLGRRSRR